MRKNLLFLISLFITSTSLSAQIVFTEINYNSIGTDDGDYLELYNNSGAAIEMEGYNFTQGFEFTFPAYTFPADSYLILAINAERIMETYGVPALQWTGGSLVNNEEIILVDNNGVQIDSVLYHNFDDGWTNLAWELGFSLELCDVNADNSLSSNWKASTTFQVDYGDRSIFGTPGAENTCLANPTISPSRHTVRAIESSTPDTVIFIFYLISENGLPSSATLELDPTSTGSIDDFTIVEEDIQFDGVDQLSITVEYAILDDSEAEGTETLIFNIAGENNVETILQDKITIVIYDEDTALQEDLILAGVFDIQDTDDFDNYGVELIAINDIPDLSIYSLGAANNGGGTDGIEIPLPAISLERGDHYFVSDSKSRLDRFFSIDSDLEHPSIFITGDDAVELFEHGQVIDIFGEINIDGTGTAWEYSNGWAVRNPNTGPDGSIFNIANWTFSGANQLQGLVNEECPIPYPFNFYMLSSAKNIYSNLDFELVPTIVENELFVNVTEETGGEGEVSIFNSLGQILFHTSLSHKQSQIKIDVGHFENGQYYLHLHTSEGSGTRRFIKS